jgi:plasmid stabilization system protein ParE
MPRVLFTAAARADLDEALGSVVGRIGQNPKQFAPSPHQTRRALMLHFPYLVIFRQTGRVVYVVASFHTSRDPQVWRQRTE